MNEKKKKKGLMKGLGFRRLLKMIDENERVARVDDDAMGLVAHRAQPHRKPNCPSPNL